MSLPLVDARVKLTLEADCAIKAAARAEGVTESEVIRRVTHEWALREIEKATVLQGLMKVQGISKS